MSDVVVTIPKHLWLPWLDEGDLPGDEPSGTYWSYYCGGAIPSRIDVAGRPIDAGFAGSLHDDGGEGNSPGTELVWQHLLAGDARWFRCSADQRCYVVAHNRLRGYAPLYAIETDETGKEMRAFIRRGGAVACTIGEPIPGFRGWRYRWWERSVENPFSDWQTAGVLGGARG